MGKRKGHPARTKSVLLASAPQTGHTRLAKTPLAQEADEKRGIEYEPASIIDIHQMRGQPIKLILLHPLLFSDCLCLQYSLLCYTITRETLGQPHFARDNPGRRRRSSWHTAPPNGRVQPSRPPDGGTSPRPLPYKILLIPGDDDDIILEGHLCATTKQPSGLTHAHSTRPLPIKIPVQIPGTGVLEIC